MIVFPVEGRLVRDPFTMAEPPAAGVRVPDGDIYWTRLALAGDVTTAPDPVEAVQTADTAPTAQPEAPVAAASPTPAEGSN